MRLVVSAALSLLAVAVIGTGTASAQVLDDVVRIGVLNDESNVYADIGGPGSVIRAASGSLHQQWWRRLSPTRSTMPSGYACAICRLRPRRFWKG
jgi:hypothetical protein